MHAYRILLDGMKSPIAALYNANHAVLVGIGACTVSADICAKVLGIVRCTEPTALSPLHFFSSNA